MHQSRIQVYIVDDDPSIGRAYARLLEACSLDARTFESVEEFLESDFVTGQACVVADVQMPGTSGLELPALLQAAGHSMPIIFVSAMPQDELGELALQKGGAAFFRKPVDGKALLDAIRRVTQHFEN